MKILILHRVAFSKARYDLWIDHEVHSVAYAGSCGDLPPDLPCTRLGILAPEQRLVWARESKIEGVVALSEYDLEVAASLREDLGIAREGLDLESVTRVRDKVVMKELLSAAGIRVPGCVRLGQGLNFTNRPEWLSRPVVVKPVKGASSEGVRILRSGDELSPDDLNHPDLEVEEFLEGEILHIDGWVEDGTLAHFVESAYVGTCLDYAAGKPLGSVQRAMDRPEMRVWVQRVLRALRLRAGAFHLEVIAEQSGLAFLEIGHRVGGAGVAETFQLKTGVNLYGEHVRMQAGIELKTPNSFGARQGAWGWFVFPGHHLDRPQVFVRGAEKGRLRSNVVDWSVASPRSAVAGWPKLTYNRDQLPLGGVLHAQRSTIVEADLRGLFDRVRVEAA